MRLRAALLALGLATVLLTQSLDLNGWYWGLLLINAWWLHLAQHTLQKRLQTQVKTHFLAPLTRLVVVPLNVVVLTGAWVLVTLFTSQPDYRGLPFEAALYSAAKGVDASCGLVGLGQRLALSYRESIYSLMQNTVADYETGGLMAVAAWTLMLLLGSAFAWAYTQGIVALSRGHPSRDGLHP